MHPTPHPDLHPSDAEIPPVNLSLQHKVLIGTLLLVLTPTLLCAFWLGSIAHDALVRRQVQAAEILGLTTAASLSGLTGGQWTEAGNDVVDGLMLDPRVSFVAVFDEHGRRNHRRTYDARDWAAFAQIETPAARHRAELGEPVRLDDGEQLFVFRAPIWDRTVQREQLALASPPQRRLQGHVVIGMRDPDLAGVVARLRDAQLLVTVLVCLLVLPIVWLAVRQWLRPLRLLTRAALDLADNRLPEPVKINSGDEVGQLAGAFNRMATHLSSARRALERTNAALEQKVRQRTAELTEVNRRLETQIHDKNEFLRAVTHDLGAPLRNIAGMARMLKLKYESQLNDEANHKIERIAANAQLQNELLGDLLELSRIRTQPGRKQLVDLHELVDQLRHALDYDLQQAGITLEVIGSLPQVFVERNRMRQVFQNLIDNAIKYMLSAKQRRITIRSQSDDRYHHFAISDTGHGIAPEDIENIFVVFRRAQRSGTHQVPGRGVGLASVKTIIETYGGAITVESEIGRGSTFNFTLARAMVDPPPAQVNEPGEPADEITSTAA